MHCFRSFVAIYAEEKYSFLELFQSPFNYRTQVNLIVYLQSIVQTFGQGSDNYAVSDQRHVNML